jgi:hypothetical protein
MMPNGITGLERVKRMDVLVSAKEYLNTIRMLGLKNFSLFAFKLCILFFALSCSYIVFCKISVVM